MYHSDNQEEETTYTEEIAIKVVFGFFVQEHEQRIKQYEDIQV